MSNDRARLGAELAKIDQAIAGQEAVRDILSDEQIEATLAALKEKRTVIQGQVAGAATIAQGGGVAAATGGMAVGGDVRGDLLGPGAKKETHVHGQITADSADLRAAYLNRLFEATSALSLAGVDPKAATDAQDRLNLGAVYIALFTLSTEAHERMARGEVRDREAERLSALDQLNTHPRLVLLGDPGSGKSTFVDFVAMCLAGEALGQEDANLALLTAPLPDDEGDDPADNQDHQSPEKIAGGRAHRAH